MTRQIGTYAEDRGNSTARMAWCFAVAIAVHVIVFSIPVHRRLLGPSRRPISVSIVRAPEPIRSAPPAAMADRVVERVHPPPIHKTPPRPKAPDVSRPPVAPPPVRHKPLAQPVTKTRPKAPERVVKREVGDNVPAASVSPEPVSTPGPEMSETRPAAGRNEPAGLSRPRQAPAGKDTGQGQSTGAATYAGPRYRDNPAPRYPELAKRRGYEGKAVLSVEVLEDGTVGRIKLAESSGFDILDRAALRAVRRWRFFPATRYGKKVRQVVMVPVRFELH